jgi:ubiquinone/menaquinone biosynthesis C-methylase UbiE
VRATHHLHAQARSMMVARGAAIGVDWRAEIEALQSVDWEVERAKLEDTALRYPDYYLAPFHAYEQGNMSWQAALEVDVAAKSVHAVVFDPQARECLRACACACGLTLRAQSKVLDPGGDAALRASFHATAARFLRGVAAAPATALDVGCATGLSSRALRAAHPGVRVTGVDLSPYFLAVGAYLQAQRAAAGETEPPFVFLHAAAEATGLSPASQDLVSMCLVAHELPRHATVGIIAEAFRLLRPGGALQIMEMDPRSAILGRVRANPFAFTAFASTEPYLQDYLTFALEAAVEAAGFEAPQQAANSPRHRTLVAHKPR